jgi:hypothetical protein
MASWFATLFILVVGFALVMVIAWLNPEESTTSSSASSGAHRTHVQSDSHKEDDKLLEDDTVSEKATGKQEESKKVCVLFSVRCITIPKVLQDK